MSETKKINEGAVTSIADADLVMACDTSGTYRPISLANLIRSFGGFSARNLIPGAYSHLYDESAFPVDTRTAPLALNVYGLNVKAGDIFSLNIEEVEPITGPYHHLMFASSTLGLGIRGINNNSRGGGSITFAATADCTLNTVGIYPCNVNNKTGGIKCRVKGVSLVRGRLPMLDWVAAPEDGASQSGG